MNYAEDRLDRRSRYSKPKEDQQQQHHEQCHQNNKCFEISSTTLSPIESDLKHAHHLLTNINDIQSKIQGHELAARSLRDSGRNLQSLFHYGQAWVYTHLYCKQKQHDNSNDNDDELKNHYQSQNTSPLWMIDIEQKAVGDYAQMAEFCGVPELGILCLLYYFNSGTISEEYESDNKIEDSIIMDDETTSSYHCGCGMCHCQFYSRYHYVPNSIRKSSITQEIISSFDHLDLQLANHISGRDNRNNDHVQSASSILDQISKQNIQTKKIVINSDGKHTNGKNNNGDQRYYGNQLMDNVQSQNQQNRNNLPSESLVQIHNLLRFWHEFSSSSQKQFSPLLQILLVKLLYTNPIAGPYLYLATEALRSLSLTSMPLDSSSSTLSKFMAKRYKSHWAYYVLIYKIVLGERIKKHRLHRGGGTRIPYHVPIWDIVHKIDQRYWNNGNKSNDTTNSIYSSVGEYLNELIKQSDASNSPTTKLPCLQIRSFCWDSSMQSPIYALGDSHVLSIAWQTIRIENHSNNEVKHRTIVPFPVTGIKAWHTRSNTKFFTSTNLISNLHRLPSSCKTIIFSAGEIDCREGIGGSMLEGFNQSCDDKVRNTVQEFVNAMKDIAMKFGLQILLLPVAAHAYRSEKNGKAKGRAMRRERMMLWNDTLRILLLGSNSLLFLLNYEEKLQHPDKSSPVGFVLDNAYNADYTHMNSAFLPHLELAIEKCGCDFNLL